MDAAAVPSTPKSLGRSCEQWVCGVSAVHSALGAALGWKGHGVQLYLCALLLGSQLGGCAAHLGFVYVLFILPDAAAAGPGEALPASLFF